VNRAARLVLPRTDLPLIGLGIALTALLALAVLEIGETVSLGGILLLTVFFTLVTAFVVAPHLAVACTIPLFVLIPTLKVLLFPWIGPLKELVTFAAICAAVVLVVQRSSQGYRQRGDLWIAVVAGVLAVLYLVNAGGLEWDIAWAHGIRLALEPLALLLVGLTLGDPRRTLRWAMVSLVVTATFVALVGIVQQALGMGRLHGLGYVFDYHLRTFHGHLRSFGTLDEPFGYAAFLLLGFAGLVMWFRRGILAAAAGTIILTGLAFSYVRTAIVVMLALLGLWLARKNYTATSVFLVAVAGVSAIGILAASSNATESRTVRTGSSTFLTVNGRTEAWGLFLGDPEVWVLGHGVGEVGTAAERATYTISQDVDDVGEQKAVDSGYFALIADVGLLGLVAMLAIFGRLIARATEFAREGVASGWLALAFVAVLMIDAVTRASFTGFPTASIAMLLTGISIGAALEGAASADDGRPRLRRSR
jgi:hypothetical protein